MNPHLVGSREKVRRANEHLGTLEDAIRRKRETNPVPARFKPGVDGGEYLLAIAAEPDYPVIEWGVQVGDVVHNLRSSLDHLAWTLTHYKRPAPVDEDRLYFPLTQNTKAFYADLTVKQMSGDHADILEPFQPYHPPQSDRFVGPYIHPLSLLNGLAKDDKHRVVTPLLTVPWTIGFIEPAPIFSMDQTVFVGDPLELGAIVMAMRVDADMPHPDMNVEHHVTPSIQLPEGRSLIHSLRRVEAFVGLILDAFENVL